MRRAGDDDNFVANIMVHPFNFDYSPAANLASQNLLAQLEYFVERLDLNGRVEPVHRQISHDPRPDVAPSRIRHA